MFFNFNCYISSATNCDCINTSERQISPCNQYAKLLHCLVLSCRPSPVIWRTEMIQKCRKWKKLMMPRLTQAKANKWKNKQKCTVVNWFWCVVLCCVVMWCEVKWCIFSTVSGVYVKCLTVKSFCFYIKLNAFLILVNWQPDQPKKKSFTLVEWVFKWRNNNIMICTIDFIFCIVHVPFAVRDHVLHTHIHIYNLSSSPVMWTRQCMSFLNE